MPRWFDRIAAGTAAIEAADSLISEGNHAERDGDLQRARELYGRAVEMAPRYAKAHLNLGIALEAEGRSEAAAASYESALALDPEDPYVLYNAGRAARRHAPARAEELLSAALSAKPEFPEALVVLADLREVQGRLEDALAALKEALRQRPDYAGAWHNCGLLLQRLERLDEAEDAFRSAMRLDSAFIPPLQSLATLLRQEGRVPEACQILAAARKAAPGQIDLESAELHTMAYLDTVAPEELFRRHRNFGARLEAAHPERFRPFANAPDPDRRLRVGYVSSDFSLHPVALFFLPLLENHDRNAYEVHCYSTGSRRDAVTSEIERRCDGWREAALMSDEALADAINRDGIDVLIDLTGHAGPLRLAVFAQRPAPVAASWLGYLGTTGLKRIHYRICDAYSDPDAIAARWHTESLVQLPHSQWCYRPFLSRTHGAVAPLARNGFVTFGSFNHVSKVSGSARALWARVLARVPESRLLVTGVPAGRARESLAADFRGAGVSPDRVAFVPRMAMEAYLDRYADVDIALDTTPYGGGATTCDALWMGVPVVTLAGLGSASRSAASILTTVGLGDWVAGTADEYVDVATRAACDPTVVAEARRSLRSRMMSSPLMDEWSFARDFEGACRRMWRAWCDGGAEGRGP
jgi:protein O-GlcNAc transferase